MQDLLLYGARADSFSEQHGRGGGHNDFWLF